MAVYKKTRVYNPGKKKKSRKDPVPKKPTYTKEPKRPRSSKLSDWENYDKRMTKWLNENSAKDKAYSAAMTRYNAGQKRIASLKNKYS